MFCCPQFFPDYFQWLYQNIILPNILLPDCPITKMACILTNAHTLVSCCTCCDLIGQHFGDSLMEPFKEIIDVPRGTQLSRTKLNW